MPPLLPIISLLLMSALLLIYDARATPAGYYYTLIATIAADCRCRLLLPPPAPTLRAILLTMMLR